MWIVLLLVLLLLTIGASVVMTILFFREKKLSDKTSRRLSTKTRKLKDRDEELKANVDMIDHLRTLVATCSKEKTMMSADFARKASQDGCLGLSYKKLADGQPGALVMESMRLLFREVQDYGCSSTEQIQSEMNSLVAEIHGKPCSEVIAVVKEGLSKDDNGNPVQAGSIQDNVNRAMETLIVDIIKTSCDLSGNIDKNVFAQMLQNVLDAMCKP